MYFLFSVEKKKIPDAIGRYSDRLGPRPKMRSVAYRCVAFMRLKIISHRHSIESEKYFPMCDRDGGACDIFSHIIYENTIHIYSKIVPCVFPYLQCHMHLYVSAIYIAVVIFFYIFLLHPLFLRSLFTPSQCNFSILSSSFSSFAVIHSKMLVAAAVAAAGTACLLYVTFRRFECIVCATCTYRCKTHTMQLAAYANTFSLVLRPCVRDTFAKSTHEKFFFISNTNTSTHTQAKLNANFVHACMDTSSSF